MQLGPFPNQVTFFVVTLTLMLETLEVVLLVESKRKTRQLF